MRSIGVSAASLSVVMAILFGVVGCTGNKPANESVKTKPAISAERHSQGTAESQSSKTRVAGPTIPEAFLGTWDEDAAACGESFSMTRFTVSPTEIYWFGGTGDATAVRGDSDRVEVDLSYVVEGSATGEPEPTTTTLGLDDTGRLSLGLGGGREELVRCGEVADRIEVDPPTTSNDQTVALRFAPGASSATITDTLRTFALHDYLVRAAAGQQLTATLRADGPGVPTVIVIREDTYRGPEGDFETVAPNEQGTTDGGYEWTGVLPANGTYRVRVGHSGPAANGGVVSPYTLTVGIE